MAAMESMADILKKRDAPQAAVSGYDRYTKAFHWVIAIIIFAEYIFVWLIPEGTRGPTALASYHESFGVVVILLMLARVIWLFFYAKFPPEPPEMPSWQARASKWMHLTLYVLLIVLPLTGWMWVSAQGWHATLFSLVPLPQIAPVDAGLASFFRGAHEAIASLVLLLVGLHVLAALYHWLVVKDSVMQRMWP